MKFITDTTEEQIFKALISRESKFKVKCIEFVEKVITGTVQEREKKCRARAKVLAKLVNEC